MKSRLVGMLMFMFLGIAAGEVPAAVVLITSSGNTAADTQMETTLEAFGHVCSIGPQYFELAGPDDLAGYQAVLLLTNYNGDEGDMPAGAQSALVDFVRDGHGLVTGEWFVWKAAEEGYFADLRGAIPVEESGLVRYVRGKNPTITYSGQVFDPVLSAGLPSSFAFPADNIGGMETLFEPKPGAIAFYGSDYPVNGSHGEGVIGWGYGAGRVISFSTPMGTGQMGDANYARLVSNALTWSSSGLAEPSSLALWSLGAGGIAGVAAMRFRTTRSTPKRSRLPWPDENRMVIRQIIQRGRRRSP